MTGMTVEVTLTIWELLWTCEVSKDDEKLHNTGAPKQQGINAS